MKELFRRDEREALEKRLVDEKIFAVIKSTCLRVMAESHTVRLHPVELFYLVMCIIDHMKGLTREEAMAYALDEVWYEYQDYLEEQYEMTQNSDIDKALALVVQTCAELILRSHDAQKISVANAMKQQLVHHVGSSLSDELDGEFRRGFRAVEEEQFADVVRSYLESEQLLSEELDECLDGLLSNDEHSDSDKEKDPKKVKGDFDFGSGIVLPTSDKNRRYVLCKLAMKAFGVSHLTAEQYKLLNYIAGLPEGSSSIKTGFNKIGKGEYGDLLAEEKEPHRKLNEKYGLTPKP